VEDADEAVAELAERGLVADDGAKIESSGLPDHLAHLGDAMLRGADAV
jgi:hypothetical protein